MFVLLISSFMLNAQTHISVYANGSINYTPMRNIEHDFISWNVVKIDRFNYSPNIGIKYLINDYHKIILNFEYIKINLSYGVYNSSEIHYELFIYPIELGYEYKFTNHPAINSFIGAGIGYVFLNSEYVYQSGPPSYLCLGFSHITITLPLRLMILHFSHMGFTDGLTFTVFTSLIWLQSLPT